ncbi:MAG TPA: hypothetical protein VMQ44_01825 [Candidatus Saccharimonadales bacterium]|nr:hypothetical protein [Candidatus Saccharimonadales bacterium]
MRNLKIKGYLWSVLATNFTGCICLGGLMPRLNVSAQDEKSQAAGLWILANFLAISCLWSGCILFQQALRWPKPSRSSGLFTMWFKVSSIILGMIMTQFLGWPVPTMAGLVAVYLRLDQPKDPRK